jgi:hypothetical protein
LQRFHVHCLSWESTRKQVATIGPDTARERPEPMRSPFSALTFGMIRLLTEWCTCRDPS